MLPIGFMHIYLHLVDVFGNLTRLFLRGFLLVVFGGKEVVKGQNFKSPQKISD